MHTNIRASSFVLVLGGMFPHLLNAQASEMQSDREHRDFGIHWPAAYNPSVAPVFSHNELLISASCQRTFEELADARDWPTWLVIVKDVVSETPGTTGEGALYKAEDLQQSYSVPHR